MAKQIEMMSAAQKSEAVAKLLVKRAERLRTKKYPRPEMFAEEMKYSEAAYKERVENNARLAYAKKICKAAGLATDETTADLHVFDNGGTRQGVFMQHGFSATLATISVHGDTDVQAYVDAFGAYGHKVFVSVPGYKDRFGFGRVLLTLQMRLQDMKELVD